MSENVVYPIVPNGLADHYPVFKWLQLGIYPIFRQNHLDVPDLEGAITLLLPLKGQKHVNEHGFLFVFPEMNPWTVIFDD